MEWTIEISNVQTYKKGVVIVTGRALGQSKEAKIEFTGKYDVKNKEWEHFTSKTENPEVINQTPSHSLSDVVKELAQEVYELCHERDWS